MDVNVTDVRREKKALFGRTVRERALAKCFRFNMGDAKCVCRRTRLPGRSVHSDHVREIGRG